MLSAAHPSAPKNHSAVASLGSNVVLIDSNLPDSAMLMRATVAGDKVFTYDGSRESANAVLDQVVAWARAKETQIRSLSILSHGTEGSFKLGNSWVSADSLDQSAESWKRLDGVLAPSAVIDVYSCNVAAPSGEGQQLLDRIAHLTGASVFASTNLTGKGGDWVLEAESDNHGRASSPHTAAVFKAAALAAYPDSLATITVATAAAASPSPVTGTTTSLSVLGASTGGESTLTYTWLATTAPAAVTYSSNGTNASKSTTATFTKIGAYVFQVTIADGSSTNATSTVSVTVSQTLTQTKVTGTATAIKERANRNLTAKAYDQFGTVYSVQPTFTWSVISGIGSVSASGVYTSGTVAGSNVVQAISSGVAGTFTVPVTNGTPTVATAAAINPKPATGTTAALSVLGADDNTEPNLTYTWAATVKPAGSNPTFSANGTNAAKASTVTFNKSGSYTFVATIADGQGGTKTSTVTETVSQTLTSVALTPSVATLNVGNTQQFTASGFDQFGIVMAVQPTFTWTVTGGGAGGTVNSSGLYTAPGSPGSDVVKAASGAVNGTATITVTGSSLPATASPSTVTGATTTLSALSSADAGQSTLTYTWSTTGSPPAPVTFSVNGTNASKTSTATFTKSGSYTLQVSIFDGTNTTTSSTTVTVNQTLTTATVLPTVANLNLNQTRTFSATSLDQFGNAMVTPPTFTWSIDNGSVGTFNTGTLVYSSGSSAGTATVRATSGAVGDSTVVTVTDAAPTVATAAAASPSPVSGSTTTLSVLGADDGGESNLIYTWSATGSPPAAVTFSDNGDNAAKSVTATFTAAGTYNLLATIDDGNSTTTSAVTVVVSQTLTTIAVTPSSASLGAAGTQQFTASAFDQFGTVLASQPTFFWSATSGSISAGGLYTAPQTSATPTITASSGAVSGTASVTVTNAAPTVATAAAASPSPVTGTTTALSVLGADDGGASNLTYAWSTSGSPPAAVSFSANGSNAAKNATAAFTKAGAYTLLATITDAGGSTATSSVSITVSQTLAGVVVTPGTASLHLNASQQFSASASDQFGNALASQPTFSWSVSAGSGSVNSSGIYTAPSSAGSATVQATAAGISGTSALTVSNAAPTAATVAAAAPNPVAGTTSAMSVLGADDGGASNLTYTWSTTGSPPAAVVFSSNGTNAAKSTTATFTKSGVYALLATITDAQGLTATSSVTVTVNQTLSSIAVTPGAAAINENQTQLFAATAYDQFGIAMSSQPTFTWSKGAGIGSINSSTGVYTSPGAAGTATIYAASSAVSGTASITVTDAAPTVATTASASPATVNGSTSDLAVLGADDNGESNLTYTWSASSKPAGSNPTFSMNGTNASKNSTVTYDQAGNYTFTVTISDGQGGTVTSSVNVTVNQTQTSITVSPSVATIHENATQSFSATSYDQFGVVMASQPTFMWSKSAGIGSIDTSTGIYTAPGTSGTAGIAASNGGVTGAANVTVTNAAPTVATLAAASPSTVNGSTSALSALGADDNGESNLNYTWAASSKPAGANPTFSVNGSNASKNSTVSFDHAGSYTFTVTISDGQSGSVTSSVNVTVNQALTSIVVSPGSPTIHENATQSFSAVGYDQFGIVLASQPTFVWSKSAGIGAINSGTGIYTAPGASGSATITATSSAVTATTNVTVTNAIPTVATSAAASPASVNASTSALSALGADDNGESNLTYTWAASSSPAGSNPTFSANGANASKNSTVTFDQAGSYTFTVTIDDGQGGIVTSSVNVTVNQTQTSITASPVAPTIHENATQSFSATSYDQFGVAMASQPTFTWSKTAGIGSIDSSTGIYTAPGTSGTASIVATNAGVTGSASVTVTNAAPTVATAASASPSSVTGMTTALSVLGADDNGESNLSYTWTASSQPAGANPTFSVNGSNAAKNSTVTFDQAGNYTFTVTISDGQGGTVTSGVNVSVNQTLTSITVSPGVSTIHEDATLSFAATAYDQFGVAMASQPAFIWSKSAGIGSIASNTGVYTAPGASGAASITAASGPVTDTAAVTVTNAAPTVATAANASPSSVTGTTTALSVVGADDNGESNLMYSWAASSSPAGANTTFSANSANSAKDSTVTFDEAGDYTFTVTISDGQGGTATSSVNVAVNQTLTSIVVSPPSPTLHENATQSLSATGYDQFGAAMATQPTFAWSRSAGIGSVDSNTGIYTAPAASGTASITAASGAVTGAASVTVTNAAPTVANAPVASPSSVTATTTALSVLGADDNGESNLSYRWTASSEPAGANPVFSDNASNSARDSTVTLDEAGDYTFTVTIDDGQGAAVTSSVDVTVNQTLTSIVVGPGSPTIHENATQNFSATAYDQFGVAMATQPAVTWSKSAGIGSIDSSTGIYSSPGASGTATITATSGAVIGAANLTVNNAAPTVATSAAASPGAVTAGSTALSVLGTDDNGESNLTYTWTASGEPGGANPIFSANGTNGARTSTVTFDQAGDYTFTVTIDDGQGGSVTSSVNVAVNQTLTSIIVSPSAPTIHENATQNFTATGYDQFGVVLARQPVFTWSSSAGIGSIDSSSGIYTAPGNSGMASVSASSGSVSGAAIMTLTDAAPTVSASAAASRSTVVDTTTSLSALGADDNGESNLNYTWAASSKPAGSNPLFSINGANSAKHNTVTFDKAGQYTFTVTIDDGQGNSVASSVNVTVNQTLTNIVISPSSPTIHENSTQSFTATGFDQFGVVMASQPVFAWSKSGGIGAIDSGTAIYTAPGSSGTATLVATNGAVTGSASVSVTNATPTIATVAAASQASVSGATVALSVLGADDNGESNLRYTWAASSKPAGSNPTFSINTGNSASNSIATFDQPGSYVFTVTISDGQGGIVTSSVGVTVNQTLSAIRVSPTTAQISENATQSFSAIGDDQFGAAMTSQPAFAWNSTGVGSIDASTGLYSSAGTPGFATITASSGGVNGAATVVVDSPAPTVISAATASPASGTTSGLSVLGSGTAGEASLTYTWSTVVKPSGANPVFTVNGSNSAKNTAVTFDQAGSYSFGVTIIDGQGGSVTSSVSITVGQTLTTIDVTPRTSSINENATQTFVATGLDQFGNVLASQPAMRWSVGNQGGSVDQNGIYTAPGIAGLYVVTAASGAISGLATIDVMNASPVITRPAAASASGVIGHTVRLSVAGDDDGGESNLIYTWSIASQPRGAENPLFDNNGNNAAKNTSARFFTAGIYTLLVTVSDGTLTTSSSVIVRVHQIFSQSVITGSGVMPLVGTQQFANDRFAVPTVAQPELASSLVTESSTINPVGLFTTETARVTAIPSADSSIVGGSGAASVFSGGDATANPAPAASVPLAGPPEIVSAQNRSIPPLFGGSRPQADAQKAPPPAAFAKETPAASSQGDIPQTIGRQPSAQNMPAVASTSAAASHGIQKLAGAGSNIEAQLGKPRGLLWQVIARSVSGAISIGATSLAGYLFAGIKAAGLHSPMFHKPPGTSFKDHFNSK